ncbi:hypothetical protein KC336_g15178 [Hortaea werneckii]|nr:hypothetical protein KC336_g15178 [Hortaea werneckii]
MEASATDSPGETKSERLIFKLCGSIERLVIEEPRRWLGETPTAEHEREKRIARRLALRPETHSLRFHLAGEDCDETRPFDDLNEAFELGDYLNREILLHTVQRERLVSSGSGQLEAIVVDYPEEQQAVARSKQGFKATSKPGSVRSDRYQGSKTTSSKSIDAGPASHALADSNVPSYSQDRTLAGSQKPVKTKLTPAGSSKAPKTNDPGKPQQGPSVSFNKPNKFENERREVSLKQTQDTLKKHGEARHASRKQQLSDPDSDKLERDATLEQKTTVPEGKKGGKERLNVSAPTKGKHPIREPGLGGAAPQPTTTQRTKKRKEEKVTSDSDYVSGDESGGQLLKKKPKIDKPSLKSSKVGKETR